MWNAEGKIRNEKCGTAVIGPQVRAGEVYSMTKTMTPDPGKCDPGKLNDDPDSRTTLNYDVLSLDLAK